jgi:ribosomal protein S12 methylthiotransferase accessory factor YcaO
MSQLTAKEACLRALSELCNGRSPLIEPAQHDIGAAELVEIATAVRLELRSAVRVAWSDGAVRYVAS